jgi:hypothetical protein
MSAPLVIALALLGCHKTTPSKPESKAATAPAVVAPPATPPPKPAQIELPPDEQVLRDTMPEIVRLARMAGYPINPKKFVITKEVDAYEKDECNATVHVNKSWFKVTAVYRRVEDFWKFRGLAD